MSGSGQPASVQPEYGIACRSTRVLHGHAHPEMDPLTHSALGIAAAMLVVPQARRRHAALAGLAAGLLPDADIFIRSADDPLMGLEFHRHFTHAVVFQPVIAVLAATIAWLLLRRRPAWSSLLLPGFAAGLSHILCDAWTSYGTRLWWPFSQQRVSWDMISIIDPLVTLPVLLAVIVAMIRPGGRALPLGMLWLCTYLGLSLVQRHRATSAVLAHASARGHDIDRFTVKPSFANIIVWRGIYQSDGHYHAVAVRPGLSRTDVLPGDTIPVFEDSTLTPAVPADSRLARDLARFRHFSDGWLAEVATPGGGIRVIGDVRYAMLPQLMAPMWGITMDPTEPGKPAGWMTFRRLRSRDGHALWLLVRGSHPSANAEASSH